MADHMTNEWNEGYNAYETVADMRARMAPNAPEPFPMFKCPYPEGTQKAENWVDGWMTAHVYFDEGGFKS